VSLAEWGYTILFISESTSSSFMGRDMLVEGQRLQRSDVEGGKGRRSGTPTYLRVPTPATSQVCKSHFVEYLRQ
jgi:hypothetical protein